MAQKMSATKRPRGRPKRSEPPMHRSYTLLPVWLHEWGMRQPEGLAGWLRRLALEAYDRHVQEKGESDV